MTNNGIPFDAFTLEELRRQYQSADARGRIALLQSDTLPFEIARLAVEDPNVEVRQWFARHGRDYRELLRDAGGGFRFSERDLFEILRKDSDPFVRACVYANPAFKPFLNVITAGPGEALGAMAGIGMLSKKWWSEATHLERLGMVRNRQFSSYMLEELKSNELDLSLEQRRELIWAFLAARDEVSDRESNELWEVVAELPEETDLQALVPISARRRPYGGRDLQKDGEPGMATCDPADGVGRRRYREERRAIWPIWPSQRNIGPSHQGRKRRLPIVSICNPAVGAFELRRQTEPFKALAAFAARSPH